MTEEVEYVIAYTELLNAYIGVVLSLFMVIPLTSYGLVSESKEVYERGMDQLGKWVMPPTGHLTAHDFF